MYEKYIACVVYDVMRSGAELSGRAAGGTTNAICPRLKRSGACKRSVGLTDTAKLVFELTAVFLLGLKMMSVQ